MGAAPAKGGEALGKALDRLFMILIQKKGCTRRRRPDTLGLSKLRTRKDKGPPKAGP